MSRNIRISQKIANYSIDAVLAFIATLPMPDADKYRFYQISTSEGIQAQVWGYDVEDVLTKFQDFSELLIFM